MLRSRLGQEHGPKRKPVSQPPAPDIAGKRWGNPRPILPEHKQMRQFCPCFVPTEQSHFSEGPASAQIFEGLRCRERVLSAMITGTCLLAEDEALIGMAMADMLEEAGIPVIGPFASASEALAWARQNSPSAAILDFSLKDGPCTDLARELMAQGVPVIVCSGWPEDSAARPELQA